MMDAEQMDLLFQVADEYAVAFSRRAICKTFGEEAGEEKALNDMAEARGKITNVVNHFIEKETEKS